MSTTKKYQPVQVISYTNMIEALAAPGEFPLLFEDYPVYFKPIEIVAGKGRSDRAPIRGIEYAGAVRGLGLAPALGRPCNRVDVLAIQADPVREGSLFRDGVVRLHREDNRLVADILDGDHDMDEDVMELLILTNWDGGNKQHRFVLTPTLLPWLVSHVEAPEDCDWFERYIMAVPRGTWHRTLHLGQSHTHLTQVGDNEFWEYYLDTDVLDL